MIRTTVIFVRHVNYETGDFSNGRCHGEMSRWNWSNLKWGIIFLELRWHAVNCYTKIADSLPGNGIRRWRPVIMLTTYLQLVVLHLWGNMLNIKYSTPLCISSLFRENTILGSFLGLRNVHQCIVWTWIIYFRAETLFQSDAWVMIRFYNIWKRSNFWKLTFIAFDC